MYSIFVYVYKDVRGLCDEDYLTKFYVVVDSGYVQRTAAVVVGRVDSVGTLRQQPADQILPAGADRLVQRVIALDVARPHVGAPTGQQPQRFQLSFGRATVSRTTQAQNIRLATLLIYITFSFASIKSI